MFCLNANLIITNIPIIHSLVVGNISRLKSVEQDRNVVSKAIWLVRFTVTKYFREERKNYLPCHHVVQLSCCCRIFPPVHYI